MSLILFNSQALAQSKKADLAGNWYPSNKKTLNKQLDSYLNSATVPTVEGKIIAIISPHAGLMFSGAVAAYGYNLLSHKEIETAIILGFSHRKHYDGISVYKTSEFITPLGDLEIDEELADLMISKSERIKFSKEVFEGENSLELQLPFLKKVIPDVKIVPVVFGNPNYEDCNILSDILLDVLSKREDIVIIASTDLSHYKSYNQAVTQDAETINLIKEFKYKEIFQRGVFKDQPCCGYAPVTCTLMLAEKIGAKDIEVLNYANSGDITGDKRQVVGYVSAVVYKKTSIPEPQSESPAFKNTEGGMMLTEAQKARILKIAKESMETYIKTGKRVKFKEKDPVLLTKKGAFVTIKKNGNLRGCIGRIIADKPLCDTIAEMAIQSSSGDPRFPAVGAEELDELKIEISVLSELEKIQDVEKIKVGTHGILIRKGFYSGLLLPQVATEYDWNRDEFLAHTCNKAGLPADAWKKNAEIFIFSACIFGEE